MADLRILNVNKSYLEQGKKREVLKNLSLDLNQGNFVLLNGASGSGKTTFLMMIGALLSPDQGTVFLDKSDLFKISSSHRDLIRAKYFSYTFQNDLLLENFTALENILFPFQVKKSLGKHETKKAIALMEYFGILKKAQKKVGLLSGGEKQLVSFIRGVLADSEILLADEPTSELDSKLSEKVFLYLKELNAKQNKTVVLVSHDPNAKSYAKEAYILENGGFSSYKRL